MDDFRSAVEALAADVPQRELADAFARIAQVYGGTARETVVSSTTDAIAYACGRGFGTLASVEHVLRQVSSVRPSWRPRSLLDVGAGTGSASWAAVSVFDSIERVVLLERSETMVQIGSRISGSGPSALRDAAWVAGDAARPMDGTFDLVIASYVLGELPERARSGAVRRWFDAAEGELVVVEPGSRDGFAAVRAARAELIGMGAGVTAPCPHEQACPMPDDDWCHFGVRVQRSARQRRVKSGDRGFEDEKFSYIVASKQHAADDRAARILRRPGRPGGHVRLRLCAPDGQVHDVVVAKRERERYQRARNAGWGETFDG